MTALVDGYDSKNTHAVAADEPRDELSELRAKVRELVHERDRWQSSAEYALAELAALPCRWSLRCGYPGCHSRIDAGASTDTTAAMMIALEVIKNRWIVSHGTWLELERVAGRTLDLTIATVGDRCFAHVP